MKKSTVFAIIICGIIATQCFFMQEAQAETKEQKKESLELNIGPLMNAYGKSGVMFNMGISVWRHKMSQRLHFHLGVQALSIFSTRDIPIMGCPGTETIYCFNKDIAQYMLDFNALVAWKMEYLTSADFGFDVGFSAGGGLRTAITNDTISHQDADSQSIQLIEGASKMIGLVTMGFTVGLKLKRLRLGLFYYMSIGFNQRHHHAYFSDSYTVNWKSHFFGASLGGVL